MGIRNIVWAGRYHSGLLSGQTSADGATVGRFWLLNHVDSLLFIAVRKIMFHPGTATAAAAVATRVTAERMTFTGTPSGAVGVPAPWSTGGVALPSTVSIRTASTGITPAAAEVVGAGFLAAAVGTLADIDASSPYNIYESDAKILELRPGQGLVIRQPDAGVATDPRRYSVDIEFDVFANY